MRTTLDLDDAVLAAARAKAQSERISLGKAVSLLVLRGLAPGPVGKREGFPTFEAVPGHVITDDMVQQHRDDD